MTLAGVITIMFLWTNPATNTDGSPCIDLDEIVLNAFREAANTSIAMVYPLCVLDEDDTIHCRSAAGLPDSAEVTFPQRQGNDWWQFYVVAVDSSGNHSGPSNVVRLDLGTQGPVTGVELPPPTGTTEDEWYNVQGQRIDRPEASGVYFRRRGNVVDKIVRVR